MVPKEVKILHAWQPPCQVRGFANYYQVFIPQFVTLTLPLSNPPPKGPSLCEARLNRTCFDNLKVAFVSEPILRHPDPM